MDQKRGSILSVSKTTQALYTYGKILENIKLKKTVKSKINW